MTRPTADHLGERPVDWSAPGAALVRSALTDVVPPLADLGRVHLMGIAGSGMSAVARVLLERGVAVSGCESRESKNAAALRALGADVVIGHSPAHLEHADTFVFTTAINPRAEEFVAARSSGKLVLRRAAALAAGLEGQRCVAIAGTHGKTSTASLLVAAAQACGVDPSFAIGADLAATGTNAHYGAAGFAVVEADESDGSFLLTRPSMAAVLSVEADHLEAYGDLDAILAAFETFADRIEPAGLLVACADDDGARRIAGHARAAGRDVRTYGLSTDADVVVHDVVTGADATRFVVDGLPGGPRHVRVGGLIGAHAALNATAALILAAQLGLDLDRAIEAWAAFGGVRRRFESHGEGGGVRVYDDYAHHPTEVAAMLTAARDSVGATGRVIAVFQPGTYSRTQTFAREFAQALAIADAVVVLDVFAAREEPIPGVDGKTISDLVDLPAGQVVHEPDHAAVPARVAALARPGDLVITMGIGDVYLLCDAIREACAEAAA